MKAAALALAASWSILVAGPMAQAFAEPAPSRATVQSRVRGLLAEEEGVVRGLDALDREIESLVRQTESARIDLADLGVVLEGLETEVATLEAGTAVQRARLQRRLRARYRTEQTGYLRVLLGAGDLSALVRRQVYLRRIVRADLELAASLRADTASLRRARDERSTRRVRLRELEEASRRRRQALESDRRVRNAALRRLRGRRDAYQRALGVQADERASIVELITSGQASGAAPVGAFAAEKGRLPSPAVGPIIESFGRHVDPLHGTATVSNGQSIGATMGAPVRAVFDGRVVYSGWFKGFGNLLMIDHGDRYHTLYAHLGADDRKPVGVQVTQGETVAVVSDSGSLRGPMLYFEIRRGRSPLDPATWLRATP